MLRKFGLIMVASLMAAPIAVAADLEPEVYVEPVEAEPRDIVFDLGIGAQLQPQFPSAQKYEVVPYPLFSLKFLRLPGVGEVVTGRESSFTIYPAFNVVGEREESDAAYLAGLGDVDLAIELGAGAAARVGMVRAFAEVRYGITGHDGFVGEAGVDLIANPTPRFEVRAGPRVSAATDNYMETYFSVAPTALVLPQYEADGGFKDVGAAAVASYAITEKLRIIGRAQYSHFVGDAGDSPIVSAGNRDEVRLGIGLTYRFGLDLY